MTNAKFFKDGMTAKVALGELENDTSQLLKCIGEEGLVAPESFAASGGREASENFKQGAFARAAGANDEAKLLRGKVKGDAAKYGERSGGGMVADVTKMKHGRSLPSV